MKKTITTNLDTDKRIILLPARLTTIILLWLFMFFAATTAYAQTSGSCGANLTWSYNEATYTLTISGTGDMYD
jgi:hypothetical protein